MNSAGNNSCVPALILALNLAFSLYSAFHVSSTQTTPDVWCFVCCQSKLRRAKFVPSENEIPDRYALDCVINMPRKLSSALCSRVVKLHVIDNLSPQDIAQFLSVGKTFVNIFLKTYRETKRVKYTRGINRRGSKRSLVGK
jgi:hypothetical protein